MKTRKSILYLLSAGMISFLTLSGLYVKDYKKTKKKLATIESKHKSLKQVVKFLSSDSLHLQKFAYKTNGEVAYLPLQLSNLAMSDKQGIVLDTKKVHIRNVYPYNPSLVKTNNGYDIYFRYDELSFDSTNEMFYPNIGVVSLNEHFEQGKDEFKRIDLGTSYAEDPRTIKIGNKIYLFYNDKDSVINSSRFMAVAEIDPSTHKVNYTTALDMNLNWVEKNWSPFEYVDDKNNSHILLEYKFHPRKIIELADTKINDLRNVPLPREVSLHGADWSYKWGEMRGGAPAQKIGDEYLGFFHSSFKEGGIVWFAMGCYTFEGKYPFRLTGISKQPIIFNGMYDSPITHTAPIDKRVIYPCGYILEQEGDKTLIKLACGENDCAIKIITLDLEKLKDSLLKVKYTRTANSN